MDELLAFVHARLVGEERVAQAASEGWRTMPFGRSAGTGIDAEALLHAAMQSPARTLRDVQARRTTLVRCQEEMLSGIPRLVWFARMTVWEMAQRWNDHEDYKEDWKP